MVLRHELQHTETLMQQTLWLAGLAAPRPGAADGTGFELVDVPGGTFAMGAGGGFAYDNERPHRVREVAPFRIAAQTRHQRDVRRPGFEPMRPDGCCALRARTPSVVRSARP